MQTIASMMRIQARQNANSPVAAILLDNKLRLENFALLHQQLYKNEDSVENVDLQTFINIMIDKLQFSHGIKAAQLQSHITIENKTLAVETALSIGLILNELLTNSMKYAYPSLSEKQPLKITIHLEKDQLLYTDNGQAVKPDFDFTKNSGFGIKFISTFVKQIKGKHAFYVDNGVHFNLTF